MHGAVRWVVILAAMLLAATALHAQVVDEAGPFAQPILRRGVEHYARILGLDAEQRAQALELYVGYKGAYRTLLKEGDAAVTKAGETTDAREDTSMARFKATKDFIDAADRLEAGYFEDVAALLRPEQAGAMERVKRARAREVGMRFAFASGEGLDLVTLAEDLKITRTGEVGDALDQYEQDADRMLKVKHDGFVKLFTEVIERGDLGRDPEFMERAFSGIYETSLKLRNINRQHARRIAAVLPDDTRPTWEREVQVRSYPRVYALSRVETLTAWATGLADLTPTQREEIGHVTEAYTREATAANAALCEALSAAQEEVPGNALHAMSSQRAEDHPLELAIQARRKVEEAHTERLLKVLTPEQREKAPARDEKDRPFSERAEIMPDLPEHEAHEEMEREG